MPLKIMQALLDNIFSPPDYNMVNESLISPALQIRCLLIIHDPSVSPQVHIFLITTEVFHQIQRSAALLDGLLYIRFPFNSGTHMYVFLKKR